MFITLIKLYIAMYLDDRAYKIKYLRFKNCFIPKTFSFQIFFYIFLFYIQNNKTYVQQI